MTTTAQDGTGVLIDPDTIGYQYDEEALGFEEPARLPAHVSNPGRMASAAIIALGLLGSIVALAGSPIVGTWTGMLLSFGLLIAGAVGYFWFTYKDTVAGIKHDGLMFSSSMHRGVIGWILGITITGFYTILYWSPEYLGRAIAIVEPLAQTLAGQPADQWFLYGFMYTLAIFVFGIRMFMKYRHNRYHQIRTLSVMFFQTGLAFLVPQFLRKLNEPEFYFTYFWPLKYEYLFPGTVDYLTESPGGLGVFMVFWGAMASFVATPILTYFYGKRWYCSWVCGCGGLAETLGDPWRQLTPKSTTSWKVERLIIYSVLLLITLTTIVLWSTNASDSGAISDLAEPMRQWYGFYIGALFSGVIGVGFYPILGNRVWCRFGCPMAAILGIIQRFFSRFRITTNGGQCMSCGNCTTYCEMGIDVRAYAERGENIVRASCVGCGVCSGVCPRGVLKLENGTSHADRYPGSENPADAFAQALKGVRVYGDKDGYV
jgi:ferredoxin-type protein NapH